MFRAERLATAVVALPASAQLHSKPFVNILEIGNPFHAQMPLDAGAHAADPARPVRILHCPTDPTAKGTASIRRAVGRCREEGIAIDYREISGRPNREVLRAIQWCDFVIDELFSDTPMAKFATEAAFFQKPAIVGSYAAGHYLSAARPELPPTYLCHPDELDEAVRRLASDPATRSDLGARAKQFVSTKWAPKHVAERVMLVLAGEAPTNWLVDPHDLTYVRGWGIHEEALRTRLRRLLEDFGVDALCIPGGSQLRDLVVDFALAGSNARLGATPSPDLSA